MLLEYLDVNIQLTILDTINSKQRAPATEAPELVASGQMRLTH